jgi:hypothetical protein
MRLNLRHHPKKRQMGITTVVDEFTASGDYEIVMPKTPTGVILASAGEPIQIIVRTKQ